MPTSTPDSHPASHASLLARHKGPGQLGCDHLRYGKKSHCPRHLCACLCTSDNQLQFLLHLAVAAGKHKLKPPRRRIRHPLVQLDAIPMHVQTPKECIEHMPRHWAILSKRGPAGPCPQVVSRKVASESRTEVAGRPRHDQEPPQFGSGGTVHRHRNMA